MTRVASLTGTPGTGKTTVADRMAGMGWSPVDLTELARRSGAIVGRDEDRQTDEVDEDILRDAVLAEVSGRPGDGPQVLVGHMAHLMPCDHVVVLRTSPRVLRQRLESRGWPPAKVLENVEAEAVGVILVEAMEVEPPVPVLEVDTTSRTPEETARLVVASLEGERTGQEPGHVDWSDEVMGWY